jgi:hypothetical protein
VLGRLSFNVTLCFVRMPVARYAFGCMLWELFVNNNGRAMAARLAAPQFRFLSGSAAVAALEDVELMGSLREAWQARARAREAVDCCRLSLFRDDCCRLSLRRQTLTGHFSHPTLRMLFWCTCSRCIPQGVDRASCVPECPSKVLDLVALCTHMQPRKRLDFASIVAELSVLSRECGRITYDNGGRRLVRDDIFCSPGAR